MAADEGAKSLIDGLSTADLPPITTYAVVLEALDDQKISKGKLAKSMKSSWKKQPEEYVEAGSNLEDCMSKFFGCHAVWGGTAKLLKT